MRNGECGIEAVSDSLRIPNSAFRMGVGNYLVLMVPWPVALLTLFYGVIAAISAANAWNIAAGVVQRPLVWPLVWLALSGGAMCGLPLLQAWGRQLAIWTSSLLMVATLAAAGLFILGGRPGAALAVTLSTAFHAMVIRYLQRPTVRAYFMAGDR